MSRGRVILLAAMIAVVACYHTNTTGDPGPLTSADPEQPSSDRDSATRQTDVIVIGEDSTDSCDSDGHYTVTWPDGAHCTTELVDFSNLAKLRLKPTSGASLDY